MRLLLASLLTTVGAALPAQQFDTRGLPADAAIILVTAPTAGLQINSSPAMKALRERAEKLSLKTAANAAGKANYDKIMRDEMGLDLNDPHNSFAVGVNIANGANGEPVFSGAVIMRVKVDPKKVAAFAQKNGVATLSAGGKTGWNALEFAAAVDGRKGATPATDPDSFVLGLFVVDASTIVLTQPKDAAACFASLAGKTPPYALGAAAKSLVTETGKPYGFAAVNLARLPKDAPDVEKMGLVSAMMAFGENGPNQVYKIAGNFTSAEKAKTAGQQIQGFMAAAPLLLAIDPSEPPEQQAIKKMGADFVASIQPVKVNGNTASMTMSIETEKLFGMVSQIMDLAEKQAEAQGNGGATTPAVKANGGKKKPAPAPTTK
jgi:hypothetical protein